MSSELQTEIASDKSLDTEIFEEYLDNWRLNAEWSRLSNVLETKYSGHRFDVVVADGAGAIKLLMNAPPEFLRNTRVVFVSVTDLDVPSTLPPNITGVLTHVDYIGTVTLAAALQPDLQQLYYIVRESLNEAARNHSLRRELQNVPKGIRVSFWEQDDLPSLLKKVRILPPHAAILFDAYYEDSSGRTYSPARVCSEVAEYPNAPVYTLYQTMIGNCAVGGVVVNFETVGRQAATMILGLLHMVHRYQRCPLNNPRISWPSTGDNSSDSASPRA